MTPPVLTELTLAGAPERWRAAGFEPDGEELTVGAVRLRLAGEDAGRRIVRWALDGLRPADLDGLPTEPAAGPAPQPREAPHPNGATRLDHLVAFSPDLDRTVAALESAGLDLRRIREGPTAAGAHRQAFFRVGEPILEVIEHPPGTDAAQDRDAPARFWGLAFVTEDIDATAAALGPLLGEVRDAIQPGRRIGTVRRDAGLGLPVAFMS